MVIHYLGNFKVKRSIVVRKKCWSLNECKNKCLSIANSNIIVRNLFPSSVKQNKFIGGKWKSSRGGGGTEINVSVYLSVRPM